MVRNLSQCANALILHPGHRFLKCHANKPCHSTYYCSHQQDRQRGFVSFQETTNLIPAA